jgi:hypothetical protein
MTDIRHVWVLGADLELLRADQIIRVYVKRDGDEEPLTLRQLGTLTGEVEVCADVLGGGDGASREAVLLTCHMSQAARAVVTFPDDLARCAGNSDAKFLYLYPELNKDVQGLPIDWVASEDPPEEWPNIYGELLEISKNRNRRR